MLFKARMWRQVALGGLLAAGCTGTVAEQGWDDDRAGDDGDGPGAGGAGAGGGGAGPSTPSACKQRGLAVGTTYLARLTNTEYRATLASLFPNLTFDLPDLPREEAKGGFDNEAKRQAPQPVYVDAYRAAANNVGAAVAKAPASVLPCTPKAAAEEEACGKSFLDRFLVNAFRRTPTDDELASYLSFFKQARSEHGFATAVGMVVTRALQGPQFLYRIEEGTPVSGTPNLLELGGYEVASRLSYLLWDTMPDAALLEAARSGALSKPEELEKQARRMLDEGRARTAVGEFHRQWLALDAVYRANKDPKTFPKWSGEVEASLRASLEALVARAFWEPGGGLGRLLTEARAEVDARTAPIFGVAAPAGAERSMAVLPASERAGLLTHPAMMAALGHEKSHAPIKRGAYVMQRLLCRPPPPAPPDVNNVQPEQDAAKPVTTRALLETSHENGACGACHKQIDGIGFSFENYDGIGAFRTSENGLPVDPRGVFFDDDGAHQVANGVELSSKLAESRQVQACVAEQWMRYALAVGADEVDDCAVSALASKLVASKLDLREMVIALVKSDAFRHRRLPSQ